MLSMKASKITIGSRTHEKQGQVLCMAKNKNSEQGRRKKKCEQKLMLESEECMHGDGQIV